MVDQVWEVVGGVDKGGIMVRAGQDLGSLALDERLSTGALVRQLELKAERLSFQRLTGTGPDSGWVSTHLKGKELLVKTDKAASEELSGASAGPIMPLHEQRPGTPYVYYHAINFLDTKPSGMRMSACMGIMDEARTESHSLCDHSVGNIRNISDPHIELVIELCPAILQLSDKVYKDGMMYQHPESKGAIFSWVRSELTYGWPMWPFKNEMQQLYLVGKSKESSQRVPIATARFAKALFDADTSGLASESMQSTVRKFFERLSKDHSSDEMSKGYPLKKLFGSTGQVFVPTIFKKVAWMMSYCFGDLWGRFYHGKAPELLWEVNMLAGGAFAALVKDEPDPQSISVGLHKQMDMGTSFDVLCFLDEKARKALYVLLLAGTSDVYLSLCAHYQWEGVPADGRTICAEDLEVITQVQGKVCLKYATGQDFKANKTLDLTQLPKP